jgi:S1-C subfamily serine protease
MVCFIFYKNFTIIIIVVVVVFLGLEQKNVIIQRDRYGYGLTVSGDNPVFVLSVREGGAAHRAGINTNDQIIKVK